MIEYVYLVTQGMDLGKRIRKLRVQQRRTLQDVAEECGFTKSLLSKIETGKVVPPVATLVKIAQTMGIKVSTLIENNDDGETVYTTKRETEEFYENPGRVFDFPVCNESYQ